MDPQRLARRVVPFTFLLSFMMSVADSHAALSRGHPSKDVRVISGAIDPALEPDADARADTDASSGVTVAEAGPGVVGVEAGQASSGGTQVESRQTSPGRDSGPVWNTTDRIPANSLSTRSQRIGDGYLAQVGSSSLRFAAPRRWPDPLPSPADALAMGESILELTPLAVNEPKTTEVELVQSAAPAGEKSEPSTVDESTATGSAIAELITSEATRSERPLTADIVVSHLNTLLRRGSNMRARFEPAIIPESEAGILVESVR